MGLKLFGSLLQQERKEALRLGITVSDVTRDIPFFSRDGTRMIFQPYRCVRYALARRERKGRTWTLLQRTQALGANLPNGFLLSASGPLPAGLEEQLRKVAAAYAENLFEFEGTPTAVELYWTEWGGAEKVRELHMHLERLAAY
jgi:hypothetical protein